MIAENANQRVWIWASPELLEEMAKGWSRAVQVHADKNSDGSWEMTFRAKYNERGEQIDYEAAPSQVVE